MKTKLLCSTAVLLGALLGNQAFAAGYCNAGSATEGITRDNVTFANVRSDECYGVVNDNDSLSYLNTNDIFGTADWAKLAKHDVDNNSFEIANFLGFDWKIESTSTPIDSSSGTWSLTLTNTGGTLPVWIDFAVALKGGNEFAAYFFDDEKITSTTNNDNRYNIVFKNNGGNIPNLSHISFYVRQGTEQCVPAPGVICDPQQIPEPETLPLLGLGLTTMLTGAWFRRKRLA